jgi:hypothetical protein
MRKMFLILMIAACSTDDLGQTEQEGRKRDAAVDSPPPTDAPAPGTAGWASCYTSGNPSAACNLAQQFCCFDEIQAPNNGWCVNNASPPETTCTRSWNFCDGNEDCASGARCNLHQMEAPLYPPAMIYSITCASSWAAGDLQMCHGTGDTSCPSGTSCVLGEGSQAQLYGLPPNLYVCL